MLKTHRAGFGTKLVIIFIKPRVMSFQKILFLSFLWLGITGFSQNDNTRESLLSYSANKSFQKGEFLKFRVHYGFFNAGYATLKLETAQIKGQEVYHAVGKGWTVGVSKFFYKIEDRYESYFTKTQVAPLQFVRRVDEGGYIIKRNLFFDPEEHKVYIDDLKEDTQTEMKIDAVQDMVSAFYYLRQYDLSTVKPGDQIQVDLFFDNETFPFRIKFIKKEIIETDFGKIRTWKIQPLVQKGRVFEGQESLTIWVSDDANKLLLRIKAALAVGSITSDLIVAKGLAHPVKTFSD